jgi:hypothetical protein
MYLGEQHFAPFQWRVKLGQREHWVTSDQRDSRCPASRRPILRSGTDLSPGDFHVAIMQRENHLLQLLLDSQTLIMRLASSREITMVVVDAV